MFATFFQWTIHAGREEDFLQIWNEGTELLLRHGSLGSALFKGTDGKYSALARWPDRETRDAAFDAVRDADVFTRMRECVAETNRWDDVEQLSNLWRFA